MSALMFALATLPSLAPLAMTALNLATWPRGRRLPPAGERVSVLVPARNAADHVEACVRALARQEPPVYEIVACDDGSSDATPRILAALAAELPALRVITADPLPPGWVGKPHACHALGRAARGDLLVFVDVDVRVAPEGIARLVSLCRDADVATAFPAQRMESFLEGLVLPLLALTYTAWFPLVLVRRSRDPRFTAACGQLLAVRAATYARIGGFAAVRAEIVDDVAFCRRAKELGARVVFADGRDMAHCRMYDSALALWRGFSKNLYEGIGASALALGCALTLYLGCFVAPFVLLPIALALGADDLALAAALGVAANLAMRAALALAFRHPAWSVLLHPLGVLALVGIALNSCRWQLCGAQHWSGRSYPPRAVRRERCAP